MDLYSFFLLLKDRLLDLIRRLFFRSNVEDSLRFDDLSAFWLAVNKYGSESAVTELNSPEYSPKRLEDVLVAEYPRIDRVVLRRRTHDVRLRLHDAFAELSRLSKVTVTEALHEDLYSQLLVNLRKENYAEIGFQRKHQPTTDFRSVRFVTHHSSHTLTHVFFLQMGMLSLINLVSFSETSVAASGVLDPQARMGDLRGLPFALTGINLTSRLMRSLEVSFERGSRWYAGGETADVCAYLLDCPARDSLSISPFNRLYARAFVKLSNEWIAEDPVNIMSFGPFFNDFSLFYFYLFSRFCSADVAARRTPIHLRRTNLLNLTSPLEGRRSTYDEPICSS